MQCGLPCLGSACKYKDVRVYYCDQCETAYAEYRINNEDYCEECAAEYLKEVFNDLAIFEQAEALDVSLRYIE